VKEDNEKLTNTVYKLSKQNDRLSQELQNNITKTKALKDKITTLEAALEKVYTSGLFMNMG
jgi:chromosome segregation ATPase